VGLEITLRLWPILRSVENAANLNRAVRHAVNHDVRQRREDDLAPPSHPAAGASDIQKILEPFANPL